MAISSEKSRQILQFIGAANERDAEFRCKALEIRSATTGYHDLIRIDGAWQPAQDNRLGHQRCHLHPNVDHGPLETESAVGEDLFQPRTGEMPC